MSLQMSSYQGKRSWQQLPDDCDNVDPCRGNSIAFATVQILFEAIAEKWSNYILSMHNYIVALEEEIYEQPANDERAPELWKISKQPLQAERLIKFHILLLDNVQNDLPMLTEHTLDAEWLGQNLKEYKRLESQVEETLIKPIAHVVDLMYKSISIHDARQSLELNTSLWRLGWITFTFLPLTFLAGFFGMNVDEFKNNPSMKWYFVVAVPLTVVVMTPWLLARKWMRKDINAKRASQQRAASHL